MSVTHNLSDRIKVTTFYGGIKKGRCYEFFDNLTKKRREVTENELVEFVEPQTVALPELHQDPWVMKRVTGTLEAIRYADQEGLEAELDLLAFAEAILTHVEKKESSCTCS